MPVRQARPNVSETITAGSQFARSASSRRMAAAEASGSSGSSAAHPGGTLERSTPAFAQTKPWRVSAMISPRSIRTIRTLSRSTSSICRGSRSQRRPYSSASGEGSTVSSATRRPSALETSFCVTTSTSPGSPARPLVAIPSRTSAATESPGFASGIPRIGMMRTSPRAIAQSSPNPSATTRLIRKRMVTRRCDRN